jgi:hypothetical protein
MGRQQVQQIPARAYRMSMLYFYRTPGWSVNP